jgi:choline dehydrogenase
MQPALRKWRRPWIGFKWLVLSRGQGATNHLEGGGFARGNDDVAYPNLMFHFLPLAIRYDGSSPAGGHGYQVHVGPMSSNSRGSVKITSTNPIVHPRSVQLLPRPKTDANGSGSAWRAGSCSTGVRAVQRRGASPGPAIGTDSEIVEWVARDGETALHPSWRGWARTIPLCGRSADHARP